MAAIDAAIERLSKTHPEHISQYGTGNELRLTGKHETCDMNTFRYSTAAVLLLLLCCCCSCAIVPCSLPCICCMSRQA